MNDEDISKITSKLIKDLATKEDIKGVKEDINGVKGDINAVKEDINGVKGDLKNLGILFDEKLKASEQKIIKEVGDFVHNSILPQLDEKADKADLQRLASKTDIDRLERKLDRLFDKDIIHDKKLKDIESIPVIAHALKIN